MDEILVRRWLSGPVAPFLLKDIEVPV